MSIAVINDGAFSVRIQGELTVMVQEGEKFVQVPAGSVVLKPGESVVAAGDLKISSPVIAAVRTLWNPKATERPPEPPGAA